MNKDYISDWFVYEDMHRIKLLVTNMCANYDKCSRKCLLLDSRCPMLDANDSSYCKYFKRAVLPLDPEFENDLYDRLCHIPNNYVKNDESRFCDACGLPFLSVVGKDKYCSIRCRQVKKRIKDREIKKIKDRRHRNNQPYNKWTS
jgi:hypothetical protein